MNFQSSQQNLEKLTKPYNGVPGICITAPGKIWGLANRPLAGLKQGRGSGGWFWPESGEEARRRRGIGWLKEGGGQELPRGVLGASWDDRRRARRGRRQPALCCAAAGVLR